MFLRTEATHTQRQLALAETSEVSTTVASSLGRSRLHYPFPSNLASTETFEVSPLVVDEFLSKVKALIVGLYICCAALRSRAREMTFCLSILTFVIVRPNIR